MDASPSMPSPTKTERGSGTGSEDAGLPLSTLLSQALVAFTIEFDNEFEHRMALWTMTLSTGSETRRSWGASRVMWSNLMRFVGEEGVTVGELQRPGRAAKSSLSGMERWGYIVVEPKPPRSDSVVRPTTAGRKAQEVWRPLDGVIENRWRARFGVDEIDHLRESLGALVSQIDDGVMELAPLPALLSEALRSFTLEFERESDVSLAICANVIRLLDEKGACRRDLPRLSGVSKEAISMSVNLLERHRLAVIEPDPSAGGTKAVRLTPKGSAAQDAYRRLVRVIENHWKTRFGGGAVRHLRESLERLVGEPTAQSSPLFRGLEPPPDGWRASVRKPDTLPHHPMVLLHRGGYPDGS